MLTVPLRRDHLALMGGIPLDGRLFTWHLDQACCGPDCVAFLRPLLRHLPGKVLVIGDGLSAHPGLVVKDFRRQEAGDRLWLVRLPAYAPALYPLEAFWNYLKRFELATLACRSLNLLPLHLPNPIEPLRHRRPIILMDESIRSRIIWAVRSVA